jgi:hypothetical protein
MLTNDLAFAADPVSLRREETRFPSRFLASPSDATDLEAECLCCSRQAGKSQVTAALAAHTLLYSPSKAPIITVAPSQRQARELLLRSQST